MTATPTPEARPEAPAAAPDPGTESSSHPDLLRPVRGGLTVAALLAAVGAAIGTAPMFATVEIVRRLLAGREDVWGPVWILVVAMVLRQILILGSGMLTHLIDLDLSAQIRRGILDRLRRLPLAWFTSHNSGTVKKAVEDDVSALHHLVAHSVFETVSAAVPPLIALVYLFVVDWRMGLFLLTPVVLGIAAYAVAMRGSTEKMQTYNEWLTRLHAATVEFVNGIAVVKAFGTPGRAHRRFRETADAFGVFFLSWMRGSTRPSTIMEIAVSPPSMLAVLVLAGTALHTGAGLSPGDLVAFLVFGVTITAGLMLVIFSFHSLYLAINAKGRIEKLLAEPILPVRTDPLPPADPADPASRVVRIEGVDFSYDDNRVLHGIDLELRPGTVTALVGPSGSGKSTLASLLPRFADPENGRITIGGVDLRDLDPDDLYRSVSFVFQDNRLLRATIAENIALAVPAADRATVREAAARARILDRLEALPRGLESVVGEDAVLSGGETQRVCIARALLADTPILVLDEATASADPENEAHIQDAITALAADRTVLVIAHRLSTIRGADQIVVLDEGHLVEIGDHDTLIAAAGLYARLWEADRRTTTSTPVETR